MTQAALITRRDLLHLGASSDFLNQFKVRPLEVQCSATGALGVAEFVWRYVGDSEWASLAELSEAGASWSWLMPDPAYAEVTFAAGTYTDGSTWTIATDGTVTPQAGAPATVTASRDDLVTKTCMSVTSDICTWTQPRVVPPIISLGEGQKGWAAALAIYRLKSRQGMTPTQAGTGDENLRARALDAEENFKGIGGSNMRPPDLVDSSANQAGAGLSALPISDPLRGW